MLKLLLSAIGLTTFFLPICLIAQPGISEPILNRQLQIIRAEGSIKIDGVLDEASWKEAEVGDTFWNKWPTDTELAKAKTEVRGMYNDQFLYISFVCQDSGEYIIQTLKRDQDYWDSDGVAVILDPVNKKTNGFFFGVNALGAQSEGLLSASMEDGDFSTDWDNKWFSAVRNYEDHWVVEMAFPFKTLRFDAGNNRWGINFIRNDLKRNMYSTWSFIPVNFMGTDLGYTGTLVWDKAPTPVKGNVSIIPYITAGVSTDYQSEGSTNLSRNIGFDAKVAISSSLNLDLTVNPDFSQVDVDEQVTNLERFNLFFPERRNFFLENSDLFDGFGIPPTRPFFSRRIGLTNGVPIPILLGARLSGNLTDKLRIGLMSIQTAAKGDELGQNYTVGAFQQRVLKRSSITGIVLNRQTFDQGAFVEEDYSRNAGMEFNYTTADGKWGGWAQLHTSLTPEKYDDRNYSNIGFLHNSRNFSHVSSFSQTGTNYIVDMGFNARQFNYDAEQDTVVRLGYKILFETFEYKFYPEKIKQIVSHGPSVESVNIFNSDYSLNEWVVESNYGINFQNQSRLSLAWNYSKINLPFATRFIGDEFEPIPIDQYDFSSVALSYSSDSRKFFSYQTTLDYGNFYNGTKTSLELRLRYRIQPWGNFGVAFTRDAVDLPDPYGSADLLLISPRIEINFSQNLFWTTFLQYNTQADNFNINSRLQWRFKPMSDLFIVYTDNYAVEHIKVKNRGIVFKLNYWLTL